MTNILLAGCGKMGTAMLTGWLRNMDKNIAFSVLDPAFDETHPLAGEPNVIFSKKMHADMKSPDMIVLAMKPQMMAEALPPLIKASRGDTVWLSIAAGISVRWLKDAIAEGAPIIRTMPNTPAAVGRGITAMFVGEDVPADMADLAKVLLSVIGQVVTLDNEADMDAVTAVSGSGPAYVFYLKEALEGAAINAGLKPELASALAEQTIVGAAALMDQSNESASQLRVNVTSPGGTTQAALDVLMAEDGLLQLMKKTVLAARKRSRELGN